MGRHRALAVLTVLMVTAIGGAIPSASGHPEGGEPPARIGAELRYTGGLLSNGDLSLDSLSVVPAGGGIPGGAWVNLICFDGCTAHDNWIASGSRLARTSHAFSGIRLRPGAIIRLKISDPGQIGLWKLYRAVAHPAGNHVFAVSSSCLWPWDPNGAYGCDAIERALANRVAPGKYCSPPGDQRVCIRVTNWFAYEETAAASIDTGLMKCSSGETTDLTLDGLSSFIDGSRHLSVNVSTTDQSGREPSSWSLRGVFGKFGTADGTFSVTVHLPNSICRTGVVHWQATLPGLGSAGTSTAVTTTTTSSTTTTVPPPSPSGQPVPGRYCGQTNVKSGGKPEVSICFDVLTSYDVQNISITIRMSCSNGSNGASLTDGAPGVHVDADNSFAYSWSGQPAASFTAQLTTDGHVSGSVQAHLASGCDTGKVPWSGMIVG